MQLRYYKYVFINIFIVLDVLVSNLHDDDDDDDDILLNYRQTKSKILNFVETTVVSFSDCEFKAHFRLSRTTIEVNSLKIFKQL